MKLTKMYINDIDRFYTNLTINIIKNYKFNKMTIFYILIYSLS